MTDLQEALDKIERLEFATQFARLNERAAQAAAVQCAEGLARLAKENAGMRRRVAELEGQLRRLQTGEEIESDRLTDWECKQAAEICELKDRVRELERELRIESQILERVKLAAGPHFTFKASIVDCIAAMGERIRELETELARFHARFGNLGPEESEG